MAGFRIGWGKVPERMMRASSGQASSTGCFCGHLMSGFSCSTSVHPWWFRPHLPSNEGWWHLPLRHLLGLVTTWAILLQFTVMAQGWAHDPLSPRDGVRRFWWMTGTKVYSPLWCTGWSVECPVHASTWRKAYPSRKQEQEKLNWEGIGGSPPWLHFVSQRNSLLVSIYLTVF